MNIWILQHYATPPDTNSGTRHFNFAKRLAENGHSVKIFASGFNHSTRREERCTGKESYKKQRYGEIDFMWVKTPPYDHNNWRRMFNMAVYSFRVANAISAGMGFPDVVWASNPHLFSGLAGYWISKKCNARLVFEVRDLWPQVFVDIGTYRENHPVVFSLRKIEKFIYRKSSKIIVLMPRASDYMEKIGINKDKVVYIPHAVDLGSFSAEDTTLPREISRRIEDLRVKNKVLVGYAGAHGIADALDSLVEAANILQILGRDDLHFLTIGDGTELERLIQKAKKLDLKNINFLGSIPKNAASTFLKSIDVGIVCKKNSKLYEYGTSFIKTFDYMACSIPIIWAVNSKDSPVSESGCGLTIPSENPDEMAKAILRFASLPINEKHFMGKRGLEYVKQYHDIDVLFNRLYSVLANN